MPTSHFLRRCAAGALAAAPLLAVAQPVSMPTQVSDVLSFEANGAFEHHSNIFRTPSGTSDTVIRGLLGARFEREVSLQRFTLFGNLEPVKYLDNSRFDYVGYNLGGQWDWEVGRPVFGTVSANYVRSQTPFDLVGGPIKNLRDLVSLRALAGFRLTQSWALIGAADYLTLDNSSAVLRAGDFNATGLEAGFRYYPGTAIDMDFVYRREDGEFPNRQVFDANGNLLPTAVDNAYAQDALLWRLNWRPSERSRYGGTIGYTRRNFDTLSQRDFSGITGSLEADYPLTGAIQFRGAIFNSISTTELLNANYIRDTGIRLTPTWQATGRMSIDGILLYSNRRYEGDPGFVFTGAEIRRDRVMDFGLRVNYEFARRVFLYGDLRRLDRTSNYAGFDFTDNWFGFGVRAAF
jgi:exopolysaccharide biosynthesis operon protein EpsL